MSDCFIKLNLTGSVLCVNAKGWDMRFAHRMQDPWDRSVQEDSHDQSRPVGGLKKYYADGWTIWICHGFSTSRFDRYLPFVRGINPLKLTTDSALFKICRWMKWQQNQIKERIWYTGRRILAVVPSDLCKPQIGARNPEISVGWVCFFQQFGTICVQRIYVVN